MCLYEFDGFFRRLQLGRISCAETVEFVHVMLRGQRVDVLDKPIECSLAGNLQGVDVVIMYSMYSSVSNVVPHSRVGL